MTIIDENNTTNGPLSEQPDLTGRNRLAANVLASWAGHFVFIIAGLILPRMIDRRIGQQALGVWDFSWSFVGYFTLVQAGVVSSINRYVARYRATGDQEGVNRVVSSVTVILAVVALIVVILAAGSSIALPSLFGDRLGEYATEAQWAVFFLGTSLAFDLLLAGFGGVVTGCHRWGIHNAIHAGTHVVTVAAMIVSLLHGGGIASLALITLIVGIGGRAARCLFAYRVCPELHVRPAYVSWSQCRDLLRFGGKSFLPDIATLLLNQTTSILVLVYLGPAAMAVFSRPRALIRHVTTLVSKFAFVLVPTASSLQATKQNDELRHLLVSSARWAGYITFPMVIALSVLGEPLLEVWMGPAYAETGATVLSILAFGYLAMIIQTSVRSVLIGLNLHGRPGVANLIASVLAVGLTCLALGPLDAGLVGVTLAISVPLTLANGVYVPVFACRQLGLPIRRYLTDTLTGPVLCAAPFALALAAPGFFVADAVVRLLAGAAFGGAVLVILYWRYVLPVSFKRRIVARIGVSNRFGATQST